MFIIEFKNRISIQAIDELEDSTKLNILTKENIRELNRTGMGMKLPSTPRDLDGASPPNSLFIETLVAGLPTPRNLLQELDKVSTTYKVSENFNSAKVRMNS